MTDYELLKIRLYMYILENDTRAEQRAAEAFRRVSLNIHSKKAENNDFSLYRALYDMLYLKIFREITNDIYNLLK